MLIRDLAWLVALADQPHVTDTAAVLGTSQPTLSRALSRLEDELGVQVFARVSAGLHLTPVGERVVAAARDITTRHDQLVAEVGSLLDPDAGVVRLAFLDSLATSLVPQVLRAFHAEAPAVRVLLRQEPAHEILRDLDTGAADIAITSVPSDPDHGWLPVQEERLVLVVPPGHRWRRRARVRLAELGDEELVTTPPGFGYRVLLDGLLRDAGVAPAIAFESQDLATIEGLVAAGLGVSIVPEPFAGQSGSVGIPLAGGAARRTIGLSWRADRPLSPPAARLRDLVVATYADERTEGARRRDR